MRRTSGLSSLILPLVLVLPLAVAQPQGKGHGKEHKPEKSQGRGVVKQSHDVVKQDKPKSEHTRVVPEKTDRIHAARQPKKVDEFGGEVERGGLHVVAGSPKHGQRLAGRVVARAAKHGLSEHDFVITPVGDRVRVLNRSGVLLLDLDNNRDLGMWRVVTVGGRGKSGAPSFCRSGAGHPVWGRQWCIDKGFGLGTDRGFRWARAIDFNNVVFLRPVSTTEVLTRDLLVGLLGDNAFNRLAAHAITLGLVEPLTGRWIGEPAGPHVLLLSSGARPMAEVVDFNRDDRADLLVVAVRP